MIEAAGKRLVTGFIFHSTPSGAGSFVEATLRRRRILTAARRGYAPRHLFIIIDFLQEISRMKDHAGFTPLTREAVGLVQEKVYARLEPSPGYIIGKDANTNKILFMNGSSVFFDGPCPLSNLSRRHGWPTPSDADYAFVELCSKRLHARMSATIGPAGAVL
jgi:hypothetical protein